MKPASWAVALTSTRCRRLLPVLWCRRGSGRRQRKNLCPCFGLPPSRGSRFMGCLEKGSRRRVMWERWKGEKLLLLPPAAPCPRRGRRRYLLIRPSLSRRSFVWGPRRLFLRGSSEVGLLARWSTSEERRCACGPAQSSRFARTVRRSLRLRRPRGFERPKGLLDLGLALDCPLAQGVSVEEDPEVSLSWQSRRRPRRSAAP